MTDAKAAPKLLLLPTGCTDDARILTLAHPRTLRPCRYFFDPAHGIYEFTRIAAPKAACKSWLLKSQSASPRKRKRGTDDAVPSTEGNHKNVLDAEERFAENHQDADTKSGDYVIKDAELLVATAIDPIFMILPALTNQSFYLSADDLLSRLSENSKHFERVVRDQSIQQQIIARLGCVCDTVHAGDEVMYRLSEEKLLAELLLKAERMAKSPFPPSMEERFIRRTLETPMAATKCEDSSTLVNESVTPMLADGTSENHDSQTSSATTSSSSSTTASNETELTVPDKPDPGVSPDLHHLLRVRTAFSFMVTSYLPTTLAAAITTRLASNQSPLDFKPLDDRMAEVAKLRADALAARSLGDFSHKRNMHEEDDAAENRLERKRRKEEEEKKKKAGETRGIRDLKKVDTKGMKKMSDFFGRRVSPRKKAP